jgi:hypothetical protein
MAAKAQRRSRIIEARRVLNDSQGEIHTDPEFPQHIYHYAPRQSIRGILESREIWLFDTFSMQNDLMDGRAWIDVFRCVLSRKSLPPSVKFLFSPGGLLYTRWCYSLVACFSSNCELPQQWRDFADMGKGCAIEFSFNAIRERSDGGHSFGWTPMLYGERDQTARAEKTVDEAIRIRREFSDLSDNEYWAQALFSFLCCGTRFKAENHRDQDEWRIFLDRPLDCVDIKHYKGRAYMPLPLTPDMVTAVVMGSNCECSEDELAHLLEASGFSAGTRASCLASKVAS